MKRSSFHTLWMGTVGLIATVLIFLAVLLSVARFAVSQIPQYKAEFERQISQRLGYQVEVGEIEARLRHYHLEIVLKTPQILDDQRHKILLDLTEISLRIDLLALVTQQRWVIANLTLHDLNLIVERYPDGKTRWHGLPFDIENESVGLHRADVDVSSNWRDVLLRMSERLPASVWIENSTVLLLDRQNDRSYRFSKINVSLRKENGVAVIAGALDLDSVLGERFRFRLELESFKTPLSQELKWGVYARGDQLALHHWPWLSKVPQWPEVHSGKVDAEVWLSFKGEQLKEIQGRLQGENIDFSMPHLPKSERLLMNRLQGNFGFARSDDGWVAQFSDLFLKRDQLEWQSESLGVWHRKSTALSNEQSYGAKVSYLHLEDLVYLAKMISWTPPKIVDLLNKWKPAGDFSTVEGQVRLVDQKVTDYHVEGDIHRLSFLSKEEHIRLDQIGAHVVANQAGGKLELNGLDGEVAFSSLFDFPLRFDSLQGDLGWQRDTNGWLLQSNRLMFKNFDLSASGVLSLFFPDSSDDSPAMRLEASLGAVDAKVVPRYYPVGIMPAETLKWLRQSLSTGQATGADLFFNGTFADFPFDHGEGEFVIEANVTGAALRFHPLWPGLKGIDGQLRFTGTGMEINATRGVYQDYAIGKTRVSIASYYFPVLKIEAQGRGPAPTVASFLRQTPLSFPQADLFKNLTIQGEMRLRLNLEIPLDSNSSQKAKVQGEVDFEGCRLAHAGWSGVIEDVRGTLGFNEQGGAPSQITGQYSQLPLTVSIDKVAGQNNSKTKDTRVRVGFTGNPLNFLGSSWAPLQALVNGKSPWHVDVQFGEIGGAATEVQVEATSNLEGVSLAFPEPIHKTKPSTRMPVRFKANFSDKGVRYEAALGQFLSIQAELAGEEKFRLKRGEVRFGGGKARLPAVSELRLSGNTALLNLDAWRALGLYLPEQAMQVDWPPLRVSMAVEQLLFSGRAYPKVTVTLNQQTDRYEMTVRGEDLAGRLRFPYPDFAKGVLQVELDHYRFKPGGDLEEDGKIERLPRQWPSIKLTVNHLFYENYELGELVFMASPIDVGLHIDQFELRGQSVNAQATGAWSESQGSAGLPIVKLSGDVQWLDLNSMLAGLGYADLMKARQGSAQFELGWEGHLLNPSLSTLSGHANFLLENGELQSVEPGAGRFIGLFSFNQLLRRLSLDFRDFFAEGLKFDRVKGAVSFIGGNAQIDDFFIDGPSVFIDMKGRLGLVTRDYDQWLTITPKTSDTLPLIGGLVAGNPAVGLSILVFQRLFKKQLDQITQYRYHVTGSWDDPVFQRQEN